MNSLDSKAGDGKADLRPVPTRSEIKVESRSELKVQSLLEGSATAFERRAHIENLQEMVDKARENGGTPPVSVEARLAVARSDLDKFEASTVYQRAQAFDRLPQNEALGNFPELDASFKQLQAVKRDWTPQTSQDLREREYFGAKACEFDFFTVEHSFLNGGREGVHKARRGNLGGLCLGRNGIYQFLSIHSGE